jgi:hypothetical protein
VRLPNDSAAHAFGFDYRASEQWKLSFDTAEIIIPTGRKGFVGIVLRERYLSTFALSCPELVQGGLSIDNISFVLAPVR